MFTCYKKNGGKTKNLEKKEKKTKGISLYLTTVALSILFSISFGMSAILISRLKSINNAGNSVIAFYAAETGIERSLKEAVDENYNVNHDYLDLNGNGYEDFGDATYEVHGLAPGVGTCDATVDYCLKSIGEFKGTRRALQVSRK